MADKRFGSIKFVGTPNIIVPVSLILDPILSNADRQTWMALNTVNLQNEVIEGATYKLPLVAHLSRQWFIKSVQVLEMMRYVQPSVHKTDVGMLLGSSYLIYDAPQSLTDMVELNTYKNYMGQLDKYARSKERRIALIAKNIILSIENETLTKSSSLKFNTAIRSYLHTGEWEFGSVAPDYYPLTDQYIPQLIKSLKERKYTRSSKVSLPPDNPVGNLLYHGGKPTLLPENSVGNLLYHGSKPTLPPESAVGNLVYHDGINDLDAPSRTRANVVCSSSLKNNNKTNNDEVKEIHMHIRARLEQYEETDVISKKQNNQLYKVFEDLDEQTACELIDEVVGQIINKSKQRDQINNLPGYAMSLKKRYNDGTYVPTSCVQFANELLANAEAVKRSNSLANIEENKEVTAEDVPVKPKRDKQKADKAMKEILKAVGKKF